MLVGTPDFTPGPVQAEQGLGISTYEYNGYPIVELTASGIDDLYKVAGTLNFPSGGYAVERIEAGGGLGGPGESFFFGKETSPGHIDFAYTKRYFGPGESGNLRILRIILGKTGQVVAGDFVLDNSPGKLMLRDSAKREINLAQAGGAQ